MSGASVRQFVEALKRPLAEMPSELAMVPVPGAFDVTIRPPGSKSLTNRALLMAALAGGESVIRYPLLEADDAQVMVSALRTLGAVIEIDADGTARVRGCDGRLRGGCTLNLNNAGTATRFLTAAAVLATHEVVIDGNARMRQRPIGELRAMLRNLGVQVDELGQPGCVPLRVHPVPPPEGVQGGAMDVGSMLSSQFVSAVMMVSPYFKRGLEMRFTEAVTSPAYIDMTARLMRETGYAVVEGSCAERRIRVAPGSAHGFAYDVEPDASGATYFLGAAAIVQGSRCAIEGLPQDSMQGDAAFAGVLARMSAGTGRLRGVEADLSLMPDTAMTLAAVACFAEGTTTIKGLRTLRVKETDRIAAIANELAKVGVRVEVFSCTAADEGVRIIPPRGGIDCSGSSPTVVFETYDDHRMAMSLALIGLRRPNVVIRDPGCVSKTYPGFWGDLAKVYGGG